MARNGSGTYSVPNTFVSGNPVTASGHNQNWSDLATELTNSVAADGQTSMTAPLKLANGSVGAPAVTFASDTDSGWLRSAANEITISLEGAARVVFGTATATFNGSLYVSGNATFQAGFIASATATFASESLFSATATFTNAVKSGSTGHWLLPNGTTGQRPTGAAAMVRYNSTTNFLEYYNGSAWVGVSATVGPPAASFKNLSIKVASTTTVTVAADYVTTTDGSTFQTTALSGTIDLGSNGAANKLDTGSIAIDSWYYIWAIAKADGTTAGLASLSSTAPTLPTGYTFKARIGAVRTIHASATLYGTWQFGREARYVVGLAQTTAAVQLSSGSTGSVTVPTWTAVAIGNFVPSTASRIKGFINGYCTTGGVAVTQVAVAPNNSYGSVTSATNPPPCWDGVYASNSLLTGFSTPFDFILESTNLYWANNGGSNSSVYVTGWEDNI